LLNDSAKNYYLRAFKLFEEQGHALGAAYCYGNLGAIYGRMHQPDSALIFLNKAINVLDKLEDYQALTTYYLYASKNELSTENQERAKEYGQKALDLANKIKNADRFRDVYEHLALLHSKTGDYSKAFHYLKEFYTLRDSLVNMDVITRMANMRTEFEVGQKQAEVDKLSALNIMTKRVAIIIAVSLLMVLLLLVIIYHNYRKKKTLNKILERQKEELSIRKRELELANNSKDRLFSIISHDLRGPVGALGSLADMISLTLSENHNPREAQELAVSMAEASRQVEFLLNNLLHWSVNQQNLYHSRTEVFELNGFINGVMKVYAQTAKAKNIQLILKSSSDTLKIEGDPNCWGTIIRNLINNSLKFTHTGGKVQLNVKYTDNHVYLEVTDTGVGMTRDQIDRLFVFSGTSREWGTQNERGQGLGLCLVHDFVKINNGHIEVDSQPGAGSTFRIIMPAKRITAKHLIAAGENS
jgi:signal transduction histidine kinase